MKYLKLKGMLAAAVLLTGVIVNYVPVIGLFTSPFDCFIRVELVGYFEVPCGGNTAGGAACTPCYRIPAAMN